MGYWGKPTSNIDWCEKNYVNSIYIAEWYNSLSNIIPLLVMVNSILLSYYYKIDKIYKIVYFIISIVFIGSFIFHSTLTYIGQLCDEIPMLFGSIYIHYMLYQNKKICIIYSIISTFILIYFNDNPFLSLQLPYGILNLMIIIHTYILYNRIKKYGFLLLISAFLYIIGFVLWISDQIYCEYYYDYYFHSWWHMCSGLGVYFLIQFIYIEKYVKFNKKINKTNNLYILPYYY